MFKSKLCSSKIGEKTITNYAENKYYTNIFSTAKKDLTIEGPKVVTTVQSENYKNIETCNYNIEDSGGRCEILIKGNSLGNEIYNGEKITVELRYNEDLGRKDDVENVYIKVNNTTHTGKTVELTNKRNNSVETYEILGIVTTKKGKEIKCKGITTLLTETNCGASCKIKEENGMYVISGSDSEYYTFTSNISVMDIEEVLNKNDYKPYSYMKKVENTLLSGKRNIQVSELKEGEILFGYVTNGTSCNNYCIEEGPKPKVQEDCLKLYKPAQRNDIEIYCQNYWETDLNGFKGEADCFNKCTVKECPEEDSKNLKKVEEYCKKYEEYGYKEEEQCISNCYKEENSSPEFMYRSVDIENPFPRSEEGKRVIGQNWIGLEKYIKEGGSEGRTIYFTPNDIRSLRDE